MKATRLWMFAAILLCDTTADAQEHTSKGIGQIVHWLGDIDSAYVMPQTYPFSAQVKVMSSFDVCRTTLNDSPIESARLSVDPNLRVGPYFGWKFVFGGVTFDLTHSTTHSDKTKHETEFTLYTAPLTIDLFYRRTGSDYRIRSLHMADGIQFGDIHNVPFDALSLGITGINAFYIFNHRQFSTPAAMAQTTIQLRSRGTWIAGAGYTHNKLDIDFDRLLEFTMEQIAQQYDYLPQEQREAIINQIAQAINEKYANRMYTNVTYENYTLHGGYAYNYVPCRNVLLSATATLSLGYKHAQGRLLHDASHRFKEDHVSPDANMRLAAVYNNMRWYVTATGVFHTASFKTERLSATNAFGLATLSLGVNF